MPHDSLPSVQDVPRILGRYGGDMAGPLVLCIGGIHGNEPAGVIAAQRVLQMLTVDNPDFRGEFVALAGNRAALACGCRYIEQDLNRLWLPDRLSALRSACPPSSASPDEREFQELFVTIEAILERRRGPVIFLDLHTTSATGRPFSVIADTLPNRRLALSIPVPVILGLEEHLEGTILNYVNDRGFVAVGFEGGQNDAPGAVNHHEVAIWMALLTVGCVAGPLPPRIGVLREALARTTKDLPRVLEVRYRHPVQDADQFDMAPGYINFQAVKRGQLLASDRWGEIRAQERGQILMPLYQSQGSDGFFLVREVRPFWLTLAAWLRQLRLERLLPWLPGVRQHPERPDTLVVDAKIARWYVIELFHLLGYRRQHAEAGKFVVSRRRHDAPSVEE